MLNSASSVFSARPCFDAHVTMPVLVTLRTAVAERDWPAVARFFAGLTHEDERAYACSYVGGLDGCEAFLEQAVADHPGDPLARCLLADRRIRVGWGIRSSARAQHVSREQFDQFHAWLRRAEGLLIEVCAEYPDYALGWYLRLITARGLELGHSETRRRYDRLAEHHPHHYPAQTQLLQLLCPKWGGSWEAAFGFAEECAAAVPPGGHSATLVAEAHLEKWLDLSPREGGRWMAQPAVRDELTAAAAHSVLHPHYRPGFHWISAHGFFAAALSLGGHYAEAAPHFRALGDAATRHPWDYLDDDPAAAFLRHRKHALAKG
ncbi:hypothetical protein [Streptomyces sp. NPDC003036]|uniref:hypothetical protein n=1 Tax=Streptomyces sp. NPDC003036 TaxID=3154442 RepID=UPI0033AE8A26